ncbi:MAG TPA: glutaminyl-peptide cyclotransferase, partial [Parasegetibacter sp.]
MLFISPIFACSCNDNNTDKDTEYKVTNVNVPANLQYTVLNMFPHDTAAFTQGLIVYEGKLLEGTGAAEPYTSSLRLYDISSGKIEKKVEQGREFFGEGIT